jgi:hypothetical protein
MNTLHTVIGLMLILISAGVLAAVVYCGMQGGP